MNNELTLTVDAPLADDQAVGGAAVIDSAPTVVVAETQTTPEPKPIKPRREPRGMNAHGFRNGSDSATIVDILVAGGLDRQDINDKVAAAIGTETRTGRTKNIPSLISGLLARLEERGYTVESSWRVVPPK